MAKMRVATAIWSGDLFRRVLHARTWQLIIALIIILFLAATALRLNNLGMIERRDAVLAADKQGDSATITNRLSDLQRYIAAHMNTSLGTGLYLQESYNRAKDAAVSSAGSSSSSAATAIEQQAAIDCRSRFQGGVASYRNDYVQCVVDRIAALGTGTDALTNLQLPKADAYRYDFAAPLWTPDTAGILCLLAFILLVVIIVKIVIYLFLRLLVRRYYHRA